MKENKAKKILISLIIILLLYLTINYFFMYFRVVNDSMSPNLNTEDYIIAIKSNSYESGDIIVFEQEDKVLIKRIIASSNEKVNIDQNGNVFVNDEFLYEPYIQSKSIEPYNIKFPYTVQENNFFIMGDNRKNSIDSRMHEIETVSENELLGKYLFKLPIIKK